MNYRRLVISFIIPQAVGILGSFFTVSTLLNWYTVLNKPSFTPPNWVFGPIWILLYFLMGASAYIVWQKTDGNNLAKNSLILFFIHLIFNAAWMPIFFGLRNINLALFDIIIIWLFIVILIIKFFKISRASAYLLIPYLIWVSYATALNYYIWRLN